MPFPLGFNDNIYQEYNISKMPNFDVFFFCWIFENVSIQAIVLEKKNM